MPKTKWTLEVLLELAKPYNNRTEFKTAHKQAYGAVMDKKLGDIVFAHMQLQRTYWTEQMLVETTKGYKDIETYKKENESAYTTICNRGLNDKILGHIVRKHRVHSEKSLAAIAKKFKTRVEFAQAEHSAYNVAINKGILNKICDHMTRLKKIGWTDEELQEIADKFESRQAFKNAQPSAFSVAARRNLIDVFFQNKPKLWLPFTKEEVIEIAKRFNTRVDFQKVEGGAYNRALRDGFLGEACKHMAVAQKFRPELPSSFYILTISSSVHGEFVGYGITNDWDDRYRDHKSSLKKAGMKIISIKVFEFETGYQAKALEDSFKVKFTLLPVEVSGFKKENFRLENLNEALSIVASKNAPSISKN